MRTCFREAFLSVVERQLFWRILLSLSGKELLLAIDAVPVQREGVLNREPSKPLRHALQLFGNIKQECCVTPGLWNVWNVWNPASLCQNLVGKFDYGRNASFPQRENAGILREFKKKIELSTN